MARITHTAIVAALEQEVRPTIRRLGLARDAGRGPTPPTYSGRIDHVRLTLALTGVGPWRAARGAAALLERGSIDRVIIAGLCGGLDARLGCGAVVWPDVVIDAATGRVHRRAASMSGTGRHVSVSTIAATPAAKAALAAEHGAASVDMESAAIAGVCASRGVEWVCVRAVSDTAAEALPPFVGELVDASGRSRPVRAAWWAVRSPGAIGSLVRLARHSGRAGEALAVAIGSSLATSAKAGERRD